jgi:hypothetical protein
MILHKSIQEPPIGELSLTQGDVKKINEIYSSIVSKNIKMREYQDTVSGPTLPAWSS